MTANKGINSLFTVLILVLIAVQLAPTLFGEADNLSTADGVPSWVATIVPIVLGVFFIYLIWKPTM